MKESIDSEEHWLGGFHSEAFFYYLFLLHDASMKYEREVCDVRRQTGGVGHFLTLAQVHTVLFTTHINREQGLRRIYSCAQWWIYILQRTVAVCSGANMRVGGGAGRNWEDLWRLIIWAVMSKYRRWKAAAQITFYVWQMRNVTYQRESVCVATSRRIIRYVCVLSCGHLNRLFTFRHFKSWIGNKLGSDTFSCSCRRRKSDLSLIWTRGCTIITITQLLYSWMTFSLLHFVFYKDINE